MKHLIESAIVLLIGIGIAPSVREWIDIDKAETQSIQQPIADPLPNADPMPPDPAPQTHAVIEFYRATDFECPPCEQWARYNKPALENVGWTVETLPGDGSPVPYYHVWIHGKRSARVVGFLSHTRLRELIHTMTGKKPEPRCEVKQTPVVEFTPVTVKSRLTSPVNTFQQAPRGYRARWTWPGDLRSHLAGHPHYVDTTGLTQDDLEMLHDRLHEQERSGRVVQSSSCPTGTCPTPQRRGLFGWR